MVMMEECQQLTPHDTQDQDHTQPSPPVPGQRGIHEAWPQGCRPYTNDMAIIRNENQKANKMARRGSPLQHHADP